MKPEEIEAIRKKFYLQDDGKTADDQCSLLSVGEARTLLIALEKAQRDRDQANEAVKALSEGKPLGPLVGSHTIKNQASEIHRLTKELEAAQAKLAAAEKARDTWEHALKCRDRQFREFMDKWEEATEFTETLKEKMESAQEENRRLREALVIKDDALAAINDPISYCDKTGQDWREPDWLHKKIRQALARPEKEGGG